METSLVLQDPAFSAMAGRSSVAAASGAEAGVLFSSTLQQELDTPVVATTNAAADSIAPHKPRGDLSDWLRSLSGSKGNTAALPLQTDEVATKTDKLPDDELKVLPLVNVFGGSTALNPLPDETAPAETEGDPAAAMTSPADPGLLVLQPEASAAAGTPVHPLAHPANPGTSPADLQLQQTAVPTTSSIPATAEASEAKPLPLAVAAGMAAPAERPSAASPRSRDSGSSAPQSPRAASSNLMMTNSKPGMDELLQGLQVGQGDGPARFALPQAVLAPEADAGFMQQALALASLRQGDNLAAPPPLHNSSAAEGLFTLATETPVGTEGWGEEIGSHISWLSEQKISKAELTLHPAELGVLDITINNEDERVTVSIVTRNEAARELLQEHLPRLADLLRQNGLALEQGSVSQHSAGQREDQGGNAQARTERSTEQREEPADTALRRSRSALLHQGQIDHYV